MDLLCSTTADCHVDFGNEFAAKEFSDQILRVEIVSSSSETSPNSQFAKKHSGHVDHDTTSSPVVLRVITFHAISAILATKSKFISKIYSNRTEALNQEHVTIRIKDSEEAALKELFNFMYNGTLSCTNAPELLNVLMLSKKLEVDSCMRYCITLLSNIPMTTELALLYLEILPQIPLTEAIQPLTDEATLYLHSLYTDIIASQDELMDLPLCAIEAILSADDLNVTSEDDVFDFVLKWANAHYPNLNERRYILSSHLVKYIRFPYMSSSKLVEVPKSPELDKKLAFVSVHNALVSKLDALSVKASILRNIQMDNFSSLGDES